MKKREYVISITGKQQYDDDFGEIKVDTVGTYVRKNDVRYITYKEYQDGDPKVSSTATLKIEKNDTVTLSKDNSSTSLVLEKGRRHLCMYDTGFGHISMGVFTSELKNELTDKGGKLKINYTLDIDSNLSSKNELFVEVKESNG